jgi:hypothetical protein
MTTKRGHRALEDCAPINAEFCGILMIQNDFIAAIESLELSKVD